MRADIFGNIPRVGDIIVRAKYSRDSSLHLAKVTGETKNGDPRLQQYRREWNSNKYILNPSRKGYAAGDFVIIKNYSL